MQSEKRKQTAIVPQEDPYIHRRAHEARVLKMLAHALKNANSSWTIVARARVRVDDVRGIIISGAIPRAECRSLSYETAGIHSPPPPSPPLLCALYFFVFLSAPRPPRLPLSLSRSLSPYKQRSISRHSSSRSLIGIYLSVCVCMCMWVCVCVCVFVMRKKANSNSSVAIVSFSFQPFVVRVNHIQ